MATFACSRLKYFRVTTYGESHCKYVGCIVDGVPPGMALTESALTTPRDEKDRVEIQSGAEFGVKLGTPIAIIVATMDLYSRPSHADWTYLEKYGVKASSGRGRKIVALVSSIGAIDMFLPTAAHPSPSMNPAFLSVVGSITREKVDEFVPVRCPDATASKKMSEYIAEFKEREESIGGTVTYIIMNVPSGLGELMFHKIEGMLAHAMLSIPATKGFEIGSGFGGYEVPRSIHNDPFILAPANGISRPRLTTKTSNSGGIQGGIKNGAPIYFRVGFKPPPTIGQAQKTASYVGDPNTVPIVEAMSALVIIDALMVQQSRQQSRSLLPPLKMATTSAYLDDRSSYENISC
ncbi:hypothetical protein OIDMADRAFT_106398 [Oidiodendron maius Zn]|uniref:Chorismate synthase n=1 Tax=Oidiodendron maius (strain Zn) TaxID=913774 RepID=A0A0C3GYD8_OIDMZ|nr:hypothetical protein OIDMADRAFT_106398 [Oidiodendron maius Zn]